jgi:hypothetical protein
MRGGYGPNRRRKPALLQVDPWNPMLPREQPSACIMAADLLIKLALAGELFHTITGTAFADVPFKGRRETWPIRSKRFAVGIKRDGGRRECRSDHVGTRCA